SCEWNGWTSMFTSTMRCGRMVAQLAHKQEPSTSNSRINGSNSSFHASATPERCRDADTPTEDTGVSFPEASIDVRHVPVHARAWCAIREFLDHLSIEGGNVRRLAARDQASVDHHLFVAPSSARVSNIGLKGWPRRQAAVA